VTARAAARRVRRPPGGATLWPTEPPSAEKFKVSWLLAQLRALIGPLRDARLCVAYSGGLDSTTLLLALARARARAGFRLRALHVDHGLHPDSAVWAARACAQARRWRVRCATLRVTVHRAGASLEAVAREARYRALAQALEAGELLLTAHHQDDQLETVLLALLRGSGVRGLAAMGSVTPFAATRLVRPLLAVPRAALEAYARTHGLAVTQDPSNADLRLDRNFLRRQVLPLLRARWPAAGVTVGRSARHLAEAQALLERGARVALRAAADGTALRVSALRALSDPERRNALRCWIAQRGLRLPDQRRLREIAGPMLEARADAMPCVRWRGGEMRRYGDRLFAGPPGAPATLPARLAWNWRAQPQLALPAGGALALVADAHGALDLDTLPCPLYLCYREGGERLARPDGHVSLKDLLQQHGIAPWLRASVPLLASAGRIIAVADLWLDAAHHARSAGAGRAPPRARLRWRRPPGDDD
jgi:tRNA(Ile)-lysidine synthase